MIPCLLDTGCDQTVVPESLGVSFQIKHTSKMVYAANGTKIALRGEAFVPFVLNGRSVGVDALVSPNVHEVMLGFDWLLRHGAKWDIENGYITLGGQHVELCGRPVPAKFGRSNMNKNGNVKQSRPPMCTNNRSYWSKIAAAGQASRPDWPGGTGPPREFVQSLVVVRDGSSVSEVRPSRGPTRVGWEDQERTSSPSSITHSLLSQPTSRSYGGGRRPSMIDSPSVRKGGKVSSDMASDADTGTGIYAKKWRCRGTRNFRGFQPSPSRWRYVANGGCSCMPPSRETGQTYRG